MDKAIVLLLKELENKSQGQVAKDLDISKTSVNLLKKETYPNPQKMYKKILDIYGDGINILGVDVGSYELKDAAKLLKDLE